ncbi:MAG TPA: sulfotransferase [Rhodanobacteraceae bacterium]
MQDQALPVAPDELARRAQHYLQTNRLEEAQRVLEHLVAAVPDDASAHASLARVMRARGQWRATGEELLRGQPLRASLAQRLALANQLLAHGEMVAARALASQLEALPAAAAQRLDIARLRFALGEIKPAKALAEQAVQGGARDADAYYLYGLLHQFCGDLPRAGAAFETCLSLRADHGPAAMLLAGLCAREDAAELLARLDTQLHALPEAPATRDARYVRAAFEHARYRLLHQLGRNAAAWDALAHCNALMHALNPYDAQATQVLTDTLIARSVAGPASTPVDGPTPIFIVGMPRSGTTLLDRMLSSHSQIVSCGELHDFLLQMHHVADVVPRGEDSLREAVEKLSADDLREVGRRYLAQTRWRAWGRRYYIDKWPMNFQLAGLIHAALPQAKIVHIARPPLDVCFSNLKAMFGNAGAYSYDMAALAHFHRQYERLATHWRQALPGAVLDVAYEELVADPAAGIARVLAHCGLPMEDACLHPERNPDAIATPSNLQVRRPIHAKAHGEWQTWAEQLAPLQRALASDAPDMPVDPSALRMQALNQLKAGQRDAARASLETLVTLTPDDLPAWLQLAQLREQAGAWRAAGVALGKVSEHLPPHAPLLLDLEQRLRAHGDILTARRCLDFLAGAPEPPAALLTLQAERRLALGEVDAAKVLIERARRAGADDADTHCLRGRILARSGAHDQAARALADCLARNPGHAVAAAMLTDLPRPLSAPDLLDLADAQITRLGKNPRDATTARALAGFHYVRFRQLDAARQTDAAWAALTQCHALLGAPTTAAESDAAALADALLDLRAEQLRTASDASAPAVVPIFLVGLPHTGIRDVAARLSRHPAIGGAAALDDFCDHLHWAADIVPDGARSLRAIVAHADELDLAAIGARYLQQAQWRAHGQRCFIDAHPGNVLLVPLIRAALPQAKIVHVTRAPLAACFAQLATFPSDAATTGHTPVTLAPWYARHARVTRHWRTAFPAAMVDVAYTDGAEVVEAILRHVGLDSVALPAPHNAATLDMAAMLERYAPQLESLQKALAAPTN